MKKLMITFGLLSSLAILPGWAAPGTTPTNTTSDLPPASDSSTATPVSEQETIQELRNRIEELDQKLRILERKGELVEEDTTKRNKEAPVITANDKGFRIQSADKKSYDLRLRGLMQVDTRNFIEPEDTTDDGFVLRRIRPIFQGTVAEYFDFAIVPEFGTSNGGIGATLQDAWINAKYVPEAQVKFGRFKGPFGLERSQSSSTTAFPELGITANLTPNFDQGVLFNGNVKDGLVLYNAGVVTGATDNGSSNNALADDEYEFVGSVFSHPFRATDIYWLHGFGFGFAGTVGNKTIAPSNYVTQGQQTLLAFTGSTVDGESLRLSPSAYYYYGPFGVLGEYVQSRNEFLRTATGRRDNVDNNGWQVVASYVLTGEDASSNGVVPKNNFKLDGQNWGAFEVVARYGELEIDQNALVGATPFATGVSDSSAFGVGLNWYLNRNIKAQFAYDYTAFSGLDTRATDRADESVITTRLQLAF